MLRRDHSNRASVLTLSILLSALLAAAWRWSQQRAFSDEVGPGPFRTSIGGLSVAHRVVDLGFMAPDGSADATFEFLNHGNRPVVVHRVLPTCGCTTIKVGERSISPNRSLKWSVTMQAARGGSTVFRKPIIVELLQNNLIYQTAVYVSGTVDRSRQFAAFPGSIDFGDVPAGAQVRRRVYFRGSPELLRQLPEIVAVDAREPSSLSIDASVRSLAPNLRGVDFVLRSPPSPPPGLRRQSLESSLRVAVTGPIAGLVLPVRARVLPEFSVTPQLLYVLCDEAASSDAAELRIRSQSRPCRVTGASTALPVYLTIEQIDEKAVRINVRHDRSKPVSRATSGTVRIEIRELSAPVFADVVVVPRLPHGALTPRDRP